MPSSGATPHDWVYHWAAADFALDLGSSAPDEDYTLCRRCGQTERQAAIGGGGCRRVSSTSVG